VVTTNQTALFRAFRWIIHVTAGAGFFIDRMSFLSPDQPTAKAMKVHLKMCKLFYKDTALLAQDSESSVIYEVKANKISFKKKRTTVTYNYYHLKMLPEMPYFGYQDENNSIPKC